jgi:tetratricopeptide (TPR) repeat protein
MARMTSLLLALTLQCASAAWKHRQLFQAEAPEVEVRKFDAVTPTMIAEGSWEKSFEEGIRQSRLASSRESAHGIGHRWVAKYARSGAVPAEMSNAERLMADSIAQAPESSARDQQRLIFATRLYYHAKWLAERQQVTAAEERYLRSKELALELQNEDLAAHSLSRLGYFLTIWGRPDEARKVLNEAVEVAQSKPNNVASYLLGKLERKVATSIVDLDRLLEADSRILSSHKVPSKDLEDERLQLISEIRYWQNAEVSLTKCFESDNLVHIMICGAAHVARAVHNVFA